MSSESKPHLDDFLDGLVAKYSDLVAAGEQPEHAKFMQEVPGKARPGLERCLKMIDAGLARAPSAMQPLVAGLELGRYTLMRELGRGGMALVWLARDRELERVVALKVLRPGLALEERHVDRFRREAYAVAKLTHPHTVKIHDVGEQHGYHYLAMEYVEGPSLATVLEALPKDRAWSSDALALAAGVQALGLPGRSFEQALCALLAPLVDALASAHELGLVHRDVKPSNILIHADGRAVIADFGLAKGTGDAGLSMTGDTLGTPYYMSPEQAWVSEAKLDHRTDVYSLGVTLYEALSGRRPFGGDNLLEVFEAIKTQSPPSPRQVRAGISKDADALVMRAMAHFPDDRYASAQDLRADLERIVAGQPTLARQEGGLIRRAQYRYRRWQTGAPHEYRSSRTFLGLPLVHVIAGRRMPGQPARVAKGWFAMGDIALGGIACGGLAAGGIACGGLSASLLFSWGGVAVGLGFAFGGLGVAAVPFAGVALGWLALGGVALGYGAIGGLARGKYAAGGSPSGTYLIGAGRHDPEAVEFFESLLPWFSEWMLGGG